MYKGERSNSVTMVSKTDSNSFCSLTTRQGRDLAAVAFTGCSARGAVRCSCDTRVHQEKQTDGKLKLRDLKMSMSMTSVALSLSPGPADVWSSWCSVCWATQLRDPSSPQPQGAKEHRDRTATTALWRCVSFVSYS